MRGRVWKNSLRMYKFRFFFWFPSTKWINFLSRYYLVINMSNIKLFRPRPKALHPQSSQLVQQMNPSKERGESAVSCNCLCIFSLKSCREKSGSKKRAEKLALKVCACLHVVKICLRCIEFQANSYNANTMQLQAKAQKKQEKLLLKKRKRKLRARSVEFASHLNLSSRALQLGHSPFKNCSRTIGTCSASQKNQDSCVVRKQGSASRVRICVASWSVGRESIG